jgi:exopolyphosphatase/pppGpp-phosphohydrolase
LRLNVLSQRTEATLGALGTQTESSDSHTNFVVVDIGGGSVQVSRFSPSEDANFYEGFNFGSEALHELYFNPCDVDAETTRIPESILRVALAVRFALGQSPNSELVGIGGAMRRVVFCSTRDHLDPGDRCNQDSHGSLTLTQLRASLSRLCSCSEVERMNWNPHVDPRLHLLNLRFVYDVMRIGSVHRLRVSSGGLDEGIVLAHVSHASSELLRSEVEP